MCVEALGGGRCVWKLWAVGGVLSSMCFWWGLLVVVRENEKVFFNGCLISSVVFGLRFF